jgi:restriction system protein
MATLHAIQAMSIPTVNDLLHPLLGLAERGDISRRNATPVMADHFKMTPAERDARIPSGASTFVRHRTGWAMSYLTKAKMIAKVAPNTYRITDFGRDFLQQHTSGFGVRELAALPGWKDAWEASKKDKPAESSPESERTPVEALDAAVATLKADLKNRLLAAIVDQSPAFFERLVLDVLIKMGYGGSREDAAQHLGRSGDEGVDGRINQDPLGLDQVFVQAKRYAANNVVDRKSVQAFVGSMTGQGATKGIFITTSSFNENAREFVQRGSQTKVVLIDGNALLELMLRHHIGLRVERRVEVLDIDQNYFDEED